MVAVRLETQQTHRTVILSERNLLALLTKLYTRDSACEIVGGEDCPGVSVKAERDEQHYGDRAFGPGPMHPTTERVLREIREVCRDVAL